MFPKWERWRLLYAFENTYFYVCLKKCRQRITIKEKFVLIANKSLWLQQGQRQGEWGPGPPQ